MRISDNGEPQANVITTQVTIDVIRVDPPIWVRGDEYRITLDEDETVGRTIEDLEAQKLDLKVIWSLNHIY